MADLISGAQTRMARGLLKWSVGELSEFANIGTTTIKRFEQSDDMSNSTISTIQALHDAFIASGKVRFEGQDGVFIIE